MASKAKGGGGKPPKNGKASNDDFDQGEAPRKQRGIGDNSGEFKVTRDDADQLAEFLEKVDSIDAEVEGLEDQIRARNEPTRKKIKDKKKELKQARDQIVKDGVVPTEELDVLTRKHRFKRKAEEAHKHLAPDQVQRFKTIEEAIGKFGLTPLGKAAIAREHAAAEA